jgi:hypothetical protein
MPAHVAVHIARTHDAELDQRVAICWNGTRHPSGEGASRGATHPVDFDSPISDRVPLWPAGAKCGLALGKLGFGSLGAGQYHGPAGLGLGRGQLGLGQLGLFSDDWTWNTAHAFPALGLGLRDGAYRFAARLFDALGNPDPTGGTTAAIVVRATPRLPRNLTPTPTQPGHVTLTWAHSTDVAD